MEPSGDIRSGNAKSRGRTAYLAPRGGREKNPEGSAQALEKSRFAEANERIFLPFSFHLLPPFLSPASRLFSFPSLHSRHVIAVLVRRGCGRRFDEARQADRFAQLGPARLVIGRTQ